MVLGYVCIRKGGTTHVLEKSPSAFMPFLKTLKPSSSLEVKCDFDSGHETAAASMAQASSVKVGAMYNR
ncbi:hypothetical protein TYRP_019191 [Tyrophagus putrescentiae]|nr:hypothetical protein TYRP_019191 [Tyrophagus putrescentiae]